MGTRKTGAGLKARPYGGASLSELIAIVDDSSSTSEMLEAVAHELDHRKTKGAAKLRARLGGGNPTQVRRTSGKKGSDGRSHQQRVGGKCAPDEPSAMPTETAAYAEHSRDIVEQLEILRTTFTAESEILARWGITEALPRGLRLLILEEWARNVTDDPDHLGRSRARLARDLGALDELAHARKEERDDD